MDYYVGEVNATLEVDAEMGTANILASNLGKASHTNNYNDLDDKLDPTINSFTSGISKTSACAVNASTGTLSVNVAKSGYTPLAVVGYDVTNQKSSSGCARSMQNQVWLDGNTVTWSFRIYAKSSASSRTIYIKVRILYAKNGDTNFGYA